MKCQLALIRLLLRELFVQRVIYITILIAFIFVWYLSIATNISHSNGIINKITITGLESSLQDWTDTLAFGILLLFIFGVAVIAWIFPNTTQKGRIELLHSKPLSRTSIFLSMFVSSLIGFSICLILLLLSTAVILGIRFQLYYYTTFFSIIISIFTAFVILSYYFLFAVLSNNSFLSLVLTWIYTIIFPLILQARNKLLFPLFDSELIHKFIEILYYFVPQTSDLLRNSVHFFSNKPLLIPPFIYSSIFAILALVYSIYIFRYRDF